MQDLYDRPVSATTVTAGIAWSVTAFLYGVAAFALFHDWWKTSILIAEVACGVSAYAAVRHLRIYACTIIERMENAFELGRDAGRLEAVPRQRGPERVR